MLVTLMLSVDWFTHMALRSLVQATMGFGIRYLEVFSISHQKLKGIWIGSGDVWADSGEYGCQWHGCWTAYFCRASLSLPLPTLHLSQVVGDPVSMMKNTILKLQPISTGRVLEHFLPTPEMTPWETERHYIRSESCKTASMPLELVEQLVLLKAICAILVY